MSDTPVLWIVGDCLSEEILLARPLLSSTQGDLTRLLTEVKHLLEPVIGTSERHHLRWGGNDWQRSGLCLPRRAPSALPVPLPQGRHGTALRCRSACQNGVEERVARGPPH